MSILEIHLLFVGIPLLLVALLAAMIWSGKSPHPKPYKMSDQWTHEPILWSATDERIGDSHGHGSKELTIGGGASGKW